MAKVNSSMIDEVSYAGGDLTVVFKSGSRYVYHDVPEEEYEAFRGASSVGQYYNFAIKGQYDGEMV